MSTRRRRHSGAVRPCFSISAFQRFNIFLPAFPSLRRQAGSRYGRVCMADPVIEVRDLVRKFGSRTVLNGISFTVAIISP